MVKAALTYRLAGGERRRSGREVLVKKRRLKRAYVPAYFGDNPDRHFGPVAPMQT